MIFIVSVLLTSLEFAYSSSGISENIGILKLPILGGRDNNLLSTLQYLMPPNMDGMSCFVITSSNLLNKFAMFDHGTITRTGITCQKILL